MTHSTSAETVPEGIAASDWANIRAAYQAHRYQAVRTETGYRASNPGQRWQTKFDDRGFTTQPDAGGWQWGLELKSFGFAGQKLALAPKAPMTAEGGRVTYQRSADLKEWFVNDPRGLEHGFTVEQSPGEADQRGIELEFDLEVRGNLRAETASQKGALRFVDEGGGSVVTYSGLKAWDAAGQKLPARFVVEPDRVRLLVAVATARYPITVDPVAQQAYLKASNTDANDRFGQSVAISGDTVVVGALRESSAAVGVDGDQSDNSAPLSGAVYVFVRTGSTWTQQAYLKASNTDTFDQFGYAVAISGDTIAVGAAGEESAATGVNGDQSDNSASFAGAAYIFLRTGNNWEQQAYLKASNTDTNDGFGSSVAISDETVVVGAAGEDGPATGVNGNSMSNSADSAGAAYVFVRTGSNWAQQAYLKASHTEAGDVFGGSVAISGDTAVVGATGTDSFAGAAYVFKRIGAAWSPQADLLGSNTESGGIGSGDLFGWSVAISGDTVIVGAYGESSAATGVNGDQSDNSATDAGAAYVFLRTAAPGRSRLT